MNLDAADTRTRLETFLRTAAGADAVHIRKLRRLSGGAVQQNWALDADVTGGAHAGAQRWVLRMDAPARVAESLARSEEFRVLQAMQDARVLAPRPLWLCEDPAVAGTPFFIMERLPGIAAGHRVARDPASCRTAPGSRASSPPISRACTRSSRGQPGLGFLATMLARDNIAHYRAYLDTLDDSQPVLEWGLRWCERHAPAREETTFIHRDYRTGNYLVHEGAARGRARLGILRVRQSARGRRLDLREMLALRPEPVSGRRRRGRATISCASTKRARAARSMRARSATGRSWRTSAGR